MQSLFEVYLKSGFTHILDPEAYDHLLFIIGLVAIYQLKDWKKVAILVTAFTVGHSITLSLAVFDVVRFNRQLIEFLIPITILVTVFYNFYLIYARRLSEFSNMIIKYPMALGFGLIHGMAFSNELKASLFPGESIAKQLLGFNIGIELGQLLIVMVTLIVSFVALNVLEIKQRSWVLLLSIIVAIFAVELLL